MLIPFIILSSCWFGLLCNLWITFLASKAVFSMFTIDRLFNQLRCFVGVVLFNKQSIVVLESDEHTI